MNSTLFGFIKKELTQSFRDPSMKFILIISPIVQLLLFGYGISSEVKHIRLASFFKPNDTMMMHIYEHSTNDVWFTPVKHLENADPYKLISSNQADAVLIAPADGLTKSVIYPSEMKVGIQGQKPSIQLLIDATNVLQAQAVENYLKSIVQNVVFEDLKLEKPKLPIEFDVRILYNPELNTSIFMIPGVMCILLLLSTFTLCITSFVKEKESGTFEMLISAPISIIEIVVGKTIPYLITGLLNLGVILSVAIIVFEVPLRGSILVLLFSTCVFICTSVSIGAMISTFCKTQQQAALASFWFLFPAIMFSGLLFPLENMPLFIQWLAYCDPLSHYLGLLRNIMLKGGGLSYVFLHVGVLALMAVLCVTISFKRFKTTL